MPRIQDIHKENLYIENKKSFCLVCNGSGSVRVHAPEDYGASFESEFCDNCDFGLRLIAEAEREEEKHFLCEIAFDIREALGALSEEVTPDDDMAIDEAVNRFDALQRKIKNHLNDRELK